MATIFQGFLSVLFLFLSTHFNIGSSFLSKIFLKRKNERNNKTRLVETHGKGKLYKSLNDTKTKGATCHVGLWSFVPMKMPAVIL